MASSPVAISTAVYQPGPHGVLPRQVYHSDVPSVPNGKPLLVVTPTDAGVYPVAVFLHGTSMFNSCYESLLSHVASHGFIAVAPQLGGIQPFSLKDFNDIDATRKVTAWLADEQQGLAHVLANIFDLHGVTPDLSRLALAGHSRGGDTAFAVALGLGSSSSSSGTPASTPSPLKFSALIGVDPVAGLSKQAQVEPTVLTFRLRSLDLGMPALVIGTGLGPKHIGGPPCAPAGVNHAEFYDECAPPRYHVVVRDYGHLDMLDDDLGVPYDLFTKLLCMRNTNPEGSKDKARRAIGGAMVAFLRAVLEDDGDDLKAVLDDKRRRLSPAVLDPVEHDLD